MKDSFSIIVPAFDEELRIADSLLKIITFIEAERLDAELIVVDDGSKDKTAETAAKVCAAFPEIQSRIIRYDENRGKGYAVKTGLLAARYDTAIFTDADLSTPIEEIFKLIDPIDRGEVDIAFGSRAMDRSLIGVRQSWRREQGGKVFNLIVRIFTGLPFSDTQCGFKAFNMVKFRPLLSLMRIERFGFDVEFLFVSRFRGLRLKEVPVRWNHDERTKVNVLRDSVRMFGEVRAIRRFAGRGLYSDLLSANSRSLESLVATEFSAVASTKLQ